MNNLAILGAGGHGRVVADAALSMGWQRIEFYDDAWPNLLQCLSFPVVGTVKDFVKTSPKNHDGVIVAIGNNALRADMLRDLRNRQFPLTTVIHARATLSYHARVDIASVVFAGAVVNPGAVVGMGAILNTACSVDHDCRLGVGVHISPGAHLGGGVSIGDLSWVGLGASVRHQICIGQGVMVGAGAVVVADVPDGATVVGNPARRAVNIS
ncbi:NeuD/PglB/VioB family sugar acetyltransferase [Alcaligenaceae bacterium]|nr:NeuD/PglB/VioB family sugar acetyltransferase [Alcaligenaceae bacterium]